MVVAEPVQETTVRFGRHFSLFDTLQWVGAWNKSVTYRLDHPLLRGFSSEIVVARGRVVRASLGTVSGMRALAVLLALPGVQCHVRSWDADCSGDMGDVGGLLMQIEGERAGRLAMCVMSFRPEAVYLGAGLHRIGRTLGLCQILIESEWTSREHAEVSVASDLQDVRLRDTDSSNGTFLDGQRVQECSARLPCVMRFGVVDCALSLPEEHHHPAWSQSGATDPAEGP